MSDKPASDDHENPQPVAPQKKRWIRRFIILTIAHSSVSLVLIFVAFLLGWGSLSRGLPDPKGWLTEAPDSQFNARDVTPGYTLDDYLVQEQVIFNQLDALIAGPWAADEPGVFSRFNPDSVCNPDTILDRNWNRSFIFEADEPVAGALLLHGLSDSPYSLRQIALRLHDEGVTVVGLRLPGHGTCPAALADVSWRDWTAAVRVAAKGTRERIAPDAPLYILGYSNGGALAVEYALSALDDPDLPRADALVLLSPMIGITPLARLSGLYRLIAWVPAFQKARWKDISNEIDPFKYSSWPSNAGEQGWKLTQRVQSLLARCQTLQRTAEIPPVLAFQSVADSTVIASRLVTSLFERLDPQSASELVLFDVNRLGIMDELFRTTYRRELNAIESQANRPFTLTLITNASEQSLDVVARTYSATEPIETPLAMVWPNEIYSLSHVAIPFSPDDPILGTAQATESTHLSLGSLSARGEPGVLAISTSLITRQRHNPFYPFLERRLINWLEEIRANPD